MYARSAFHTEIAQLAYWHILYRRAVRAFAGAITPEIRERLWNEVGRQVPPLKETTMSKKFYKPEVPENEASESVDVPAEAAKAEPQAEAAAGGESQHRNAKLVDARRELGADDAPTPIEMDAWTEAILNSTQTEAEKIAAELATKLEDARRELGVALSELDAERERNAALVKELNQAREDRRLETEHRMLEVQSWKHRYVEADNTADEHARMVGSLRSELAEKDKRLAELHAIQEMRPLNGKSQKSLHHEFHVIGGVEASDMESLRSVFETQTAKQHYCTMAIPVGTSTIIVFAGVGIPVETPTQDKPAESPKPDNIIDMPGGTPDGKVSAQVKSTLPDPNKTRHINSHGLGRGVKVKRV